MRMNPDLLLVRWAPWVRPQDLLVADRVLRPPEPVGSAHDVKAGAAGTVGAGIVAGEAESWSPGPGAAPGCGLASHCHFVTFTGTGQEIAEEISKALSPAWRTGGSFD